MSSVLTAALGSAHETARWGWWWLRGGCWKSPSPRLNGGQWWGFVDGRLLFSSVAFGYRMAKYRCLLLSPTTERCQDAHSFGWFKIVTWSFAKKETTTITNNNKKKPGVAKASAGMNVKTPHLSTLLQANQAQMLQPKKNYSAGEI